jgi:hypothetical protein
MALHESGVRVMWKWETFEIKISFGPITTQILSCSDNLLPTIYKTGQAYLLWDVC